MDIHTVVMPHIKQMTSENLLCSTGDFAHCSAVPETGRKSKRVAGCARVSDSLCCTAETNTTL